VAVGFLGNYSVQAAFFLQNSYLLFVIFERWTTGTQDTEQWEPVPPKVSPGAAVGETPSDAIVLSTAGIWMSGDLHRGKTRDHQIAQPAR
jgi:hypothetical protein